jgi:hypothetical protein
MREGPSDFPGFAEPNSGVLALRVHPVHGGEKLEIIFPADHEKAVSKAIEQVRPA